MRGPNTTGKRKPRTYATTGGFHFQCQPDQWTRSGDVRLACPECGEGEAFVMEGREDRAAVQSPPGAPAAQPVSVGGFAARCGAGTAPRRVYEPGQGVGGVLCSWGPTGLALVVHSPGPIKLRDDKLRSLLGVAEVNFMAPWRASTDRRLETRELHDLPEASALKLNSTATPIFAKRIYSAFSAATRLRSCRRISIVNMRSSLRSRWVS
jgi:hypothetical protein